MGNLKELIKESLKVDRVRDPYEAAAIALSSRRGLIWSRMKEDWRKEAREQARFTVDTYLEVLNKPMRPKKERVRLEQPRRERVRL